MLKLQKKYQVQFLSCHKFGILGFLSSHVRQQQKYGYRYSFVGYVILMVILLLVKNQSYDHNQSCYVKCLVTCHEAHHAQHDM